MTPKKFSGVQKLKNHISKYFTPKINQLRFPIPVHSVFVTLEPPKYYFFNEIALIFCNDSEHWFFRHVLKSFIDGAADCLKQFALFLVK